MLSLSCASVAHARVQLMPADPRLPSEAAILLGYRNRSVASEGGLGSPAESQSTLFDVTWFGAVGDGKTYDTDAVRAATAALSHHGGGTLLFPGGTSERTYLTGAFNLSSNSIMIVEDGATLLGSPRGEDWPLIEPLPWYGGGSDQQQQGTREYQALVYANGVNNVTLTGGGVIDGNGMHWWGCKEKTEWNHASPPCGDAQGVYHSRPHLVMIVRGTDVAVINLTVIDSPNWTLHFAMVNRLLVANNSVHSPGIAPNTDGINLDCTQNAVVEDNYVAVGDDALCVKSGINHLGRTFGQPSRNIVFRRNTIGTGHGITIGSEMSAGVVNVTFEDVTMDRTNVGIRLKSQRGRGGVVQNVTYRNIHMKSIDEECVQVTLNYDDNGPPSTKTQTNATATPAFNDIAFENVLCEQAKASYFLDGLPEQAIHHLSLINVTMGWQVGTEKGCQHATCTCDVLTMPCPSCCTRDSQLLANREWKPSAGRRGPSARYLENRDRHRAMKEQREKEDTAKKEQEEKHREEDQTEKDRKEKVKADREQAEEGHTEKTETENAQKDWKTENAQRNTERREKAVAGKAQREKEQAQREKEQKEKAESAQSQREKDKAQREEEQRTAQKQREQREQREKEERKKAEGYIGDYGQWVPPEREFRPGLAPMQVGGEEVMRNCKHGSCFPMFGNIGDDCYRPCGKAPGKCFDEVRGKGFCGKVGVWSGSCCRLDAVAQQQSPDCANRGCIGFHCCVPDGGTSAASSTDRSRGFK